MKIQILSDLHLEFFSNYGPKHLDNVLKSLLPKNKEEVDILIMAGDLCTFNHVDPALVIKIMNFFTQNWKQILFVPGNHEYYFSSFKEMNKKLKGLEKDYSNFKVLLNEKVIIDNKLFLGSTLWFPRRIQNANYWYILMNDSKYINESLELIEDYGEECFDFLTNNIEKDSIVITHHLPSFRSVAEAYKNSDLNLFFVYEQCEALIPVFKPKLWIHAHTHSSVDYYVTDDKTTRVISNPYGYCGKTDQNMKFNCNLIIDV